MDVQELSQLYIFIREQAFKRIAIMYCFLKDNDVPVSNIRGLNLKSDFKSELLLAFDYEI